MSDTLTAEAVANFLLQHPQFFHDHSELLMELSIPHESGKAISLLERQVAVFRQRQEQLQDQFHEFLRNAHANDNLFEKTRHMILALLQCPDIAALKTLVEQRFPGEFSATAATLALVNDNGRVEGDILPCIATTAVRAALGELYQRQTTYCGPLNQVQRELLFPQAPQLVSAAIVPLKLDDATRTRFDNGLPLLLIASATREHFNSSLDTLFLDFLGEILAIHLQNLLRA
ncbi:MAG TPA: DUF484 family protein [Candidatus Acidoferrum sp.]|nr:DUF484 family protein [Candidatus Acidoferrum sp.]